MKAQYLKSDRVHSLKQNNDFFMDRMDRVVWFFLNFILFLVDLVVVTRLYGV